jgi:ERCC4-type nuclease
MSESEKKETTTKKTTKRIKHEPMYLFTNIADNTDVLADVIIDTRERSDYNKSFLNRLIEILDHYGYTWKRAMLPAGDYLINRGRGLIIERKTVGDLIGTAFGERSDGNALESELTKLTDPEIFGGKLIPACLCCDNARTIQIMQEYEKTTETITKYGKPVTRDVYKEKRKFTYLTDKGVRRDSSIYPNAWVSITQKVQNYVPYFEFYGVDHLISWCISKLKNEIEYEKAVVKDDHEINQLRMVNKTRTLSLSEQQQYVIEGIGGIGAINAVRLLERYGTLRLLFLNIRNVEDLTDVGVNKPNAEKILKLIDHPYDKNEKSKQKKAYNYYKRFKKSQRKQN